MSIGDVGGAVTELVITCRAELGEIRRIRAGEPVALCGPYKVTNDVEQYHDIFGQALNDAVIEDTPIAVKVRGVCIFEYQLDDGEAPEIEGGVCFGVDDGKVQVGGCGVVLKVDEAAKLVHVLL